MNKLAEITTAVFVLVLAASSTLTAAAPQQAPRMTGQQLVESFQAGADLSVSSQRPDLISKMQVADGYLAGVADAFHGSAWCTDGSVKYDEINSAVIFSLKKLDRDRLSRPAAGLVKESLSKLFPCRR